MIIVIKFDKFFIFYFFMDNYNDFFFIIKG